MKEYKKGAISVRVSTDMQTKYSPDSQIKLCLDYAKKNNIYVSEENIYRDDGISGKSADNRTDFQKMILDAKKQPKPFDVILVYDFSRFARNKEESVMYKAMLRKKYNIDVVSITQPLGEGKERVILESMYEAMDEYYVLNLSENVKRGKKEKASRGEHQGFAPFGYNYDKNIRQIIPNNNTKDVVKFIFEDWININTTINGLTAKLNNMGIKTTRGNNWCEESLKVILNNPIYVGYTRYTDGGMGRNYNNPNTIIKKGQHEPLITQELWDKSQEKLNEHNKLWFKYKKPSIKHEYWLRGLLKCSNCGKNLIMIERKSGNKRKPFYQCNGYNKKMCNESHSILREKLESALLEELKNIFTQKIDIKVVESVQQSNEHELLRNSLNKCRLRLERLEFAYLDGIDTLEEYKAKKPVILGEINELEKNLDSTKTKEYEYLKKEEVYTLCGYTHKILTDDNIDFKIKEKIANELFNSIIYNKKDNTLYITFNGVG